MGFADVFGDEFCCECKMLLQYKWIMKNEIKIC